MRLNDPDRHPIRTENDSSLDYLLNMADSFQKMSGGHGNHRHHSLTPETRSSLVSTVRGIVALTRDLIAQPGCHYLLLGKFQSDVLEDEFGMFTLKFVCLFLKLFDLQEFTET